MEENTDAFEYYKFSDTNRIGFIRKVYGILSAQLLITSLFVIIGVVSDSFNSFLRENFWLMIVCGVISIIVLIFLVCFQKYARTGPTNYILSGIFTLCESIVVASITGFYDPLTIMIAALLTFGVTAVLTAYAVLTRSDFTTKMGVMVVITFAAVMFAILMGIFYNSRPVEIAICIVFIIIYGIYIVIDTQLIIGGRKYSLTYDDYIIGALFLYIDIIGLFLHLLRLLKGRSG